MKNIKTISNISKLIVVALMLCTSVAYSDQTYKFTLVAPGVIPYEELTGDSTVTDFAPNNIFDFSSILYNETFTFFNDSFTMGPHAILAMGIYGALEVFTDSSLIIFDGANANFDSIDSNSKKSYLISGAPGQRVIKLQYKNYKITAGPADNYINFQIWYYQQTGIIEFHYGGRSLSNASGYNSSNGPQVGGFYAPSTFSSCYEKIWCKTNPNNPTLDTASTLVFKALNGMPDSGTVYRFDPTPAPSKVEVTESTAQGISILPSVAHDKLNIVMNDQTTNNTEAIIMDLYGRKIKMITLSSGVTEINISELNSGIYFISTCLNGICRRGKFVKV